MTTIDSITAKEIRDSRGTPTIEVEIVAGEFRALAKVPSGKSAGSREACELRDADGVGVSQAIANVNTVIAPALSGLPLDPALVDERLLALDGTPDKSHLGANALLGVSMAAIRTAAAESRMPLWKYVAMRTNSTPAFPHLYMNMLNGGAHANARLPFQEYIVVVGARRPSESYAKANQIFDVLGTLIKKEYGDVPLGDEGGYSPEIRDLEKPFQLLQQAMGGESATFLAIDVAASEFYHDERYVLFGAPWSRDELLAHYRLLVEHYGVKSIEDPFHESDFSGFASITEQLGHRTLIVGDDLTVTNPNIVPDMVLHHRANAMIVKPNQVGTMTEVFETIRIARDAGWKLIVSHRSGETDDTFVSDLAVGIGAYGLKAGAPTQRERRVKYERLIEIEQEFTENFK